MPKGKTVQRVDTPITLPRLKIQLLTLSLIGDSPLVCNAWSDKAKQMMLDKQMKKAKSAKEAKDPEQCFKDSLYVLPKEQQNGALYGFPAIAFKSAAVDACSHVEGVTKVEARGAFHVVGDMVPIYGKPVMRQDMVRIAMGTADIRFRGEFTAWKATLTVRYNASVLSAEQIVNLFNVAGFAIGIGEHRPQKDGSWGMFHVE